MGSSLQLAGLPRVNYQVLIGYMHLTGSETEARFRPEDSRGIFDDRYHKMNVEQRTITETVINALYEGWCRCFFLDGPGGTSKTYVLSAILHYCSAEDISTTAVASSGIAALLLLREQLCTVG